MDGVFTKNSNKRFRQIFFQNRFSFIRENAAEKVKPYVFLLALAIGSRFAPPLGPAGLNSRFERAFQTLHPVRQAVAGC